MLLSLLDIQCAYCPHTSICDGTSAMMYLNIEEGNVLLLLDCDSSETNKDMDLAGNSYS